MLSNKLPYNTLQEENDVNNFTKNVFSNFSERIKEINASIDSIISVSEKDFLEIGGKLQKYSTNSREFSQLASQAASYITQDILKKGINELTWLMKQFSELLSESAYKIQDDKEKLLTILSNISNVSEEFTGFRKIIKQLRMLGISTKIESSRQGCEDGGFYQLAESVDKLSGFIDNKVKLISGKSAFLIKEIIQTAKNLDKLEAEQKDQLNLIVQNTSLSLETFENQYRQCSDRANNISKSSDRVSQNISDIVMSIQFHDITRQQMEHAKEALTELESLDKQNQANTSIDDFGSLFIMYDVCELQSFQLKHSAIEFRSAVKNIVKNLNGVENNITAILNDASVLLDEKDSESKLSLQSVKTELMTGLKNNLQITNELETSIKSVLKIIEDLSNSVCEIEDIGSEIELIALNARIKAAHIGSEGESLGILAEAIQKLSISTKNQTESIALLLKTTREISKKLGNNLNKDNNSNNNKTMEITNDKIIELMNSMMGLEKKAADLVGKFKENINSLRKEIKDTIEGISIHTIVEDSMSVINGLLNEIIVSIKPFVDPDNKRERNIKTLDKRYTMNQERNIHQQFINGNNVKSNSMNSRAKNEENNFGDNVELF